MKQIGLAILQYSEDYDELMPTKGFTPDGNAYVSWENEVARLYIKNGGGVYTPGQGDTGNTGGVFACPSNPYLGNGYASNGGVSQYRADYACNYNSSYNTSGSGNGTFGDVGKIVNIASIQAPASTINLMENNHKSSDWDVNIVNTAYSSGCNPSTNAGYFAGHTQTGNFLFNDGHAKSMRPGADFVGEGRRQRFGQLLDA